jgi:hypothetical protein
MGRDVGAGGDHGRAERGETRDHHREKQPNARESKADKHYPDGDRAHSRHYQTMCSIIRTPITRHYVAIEPWRDMKVAHRRCVILAFQEIPKMGPRIGVLPEDRNRAPKASAPRVEIG